MEGLMAGMSLVGMYQQQDAQNKQQDLMKKGLKMDDAIKGKQLEGLTELQSLAKGYDPAQETRTAIADASAVTGKTLETSLRNLVGQYSKFGGVPGLSSKWNTNVQGMTDRVTDPLRRFAAERATGDTQRKMNAWQMAIGAAPGNFGDSYFKAAQSMNVPSGMGSFQGILQALRGFGGGGGAGGSGDLRMGGGGNASNSGNLPAPVGML